MKGVVGLLKRSLTVKICPLCVVALAGLGVAGTAFVAGRVTGQTELPALAAVVTPAKPAASGAAGTFKVDVVHSTVVFAIKHMNVAYNYGRFDKLDGSFNFDAAAPERSTLEVIVDASSISTANDKRDNHLKSGDFFSAKEFPQLTFKSKSVKKAGDKFEVAGDLTVKGQTKPMTVMVQDTGRGPGRKGEVAGMRTTFTFKRSDFGMDYMIGKGLADEVEVTVSLEGTQG